MTACFKSLLYLAAMREYIVYALINPFDGQPFYVGCTNNLKRRIYEHTQPSGTNNQEKDLLIKKIKGAGLMLWAQQLWVGQSTKEQAEKKEMFWIKKLSNRGVSLLNKNSGGNTPPSQRGKIGTPELKQKLIEASTQKKAVAQYTKQGEFVQWFIGVREACRRTGIDHRSIAQVANGSKIRKSAGGYLWKYI